MVSLTTFPSSALQSQREECEDVYDPRRQQRVQSISIAQWIYLEHL